MSELHVLFVPWPRSLGSTIDESTTFADNITFLDTDASNTASPVTPEMKISRVGLKNPERPLTNDGGEYRYKNKQWLKFIADRNKKLALDKQKSYSEVWYTGKMSMLLFSMKTGVVYLRGHCMPNQDHLHSGNSKLMYSEVADRLFDSGLPQDFAGKIKCYNCHSGEGGNKSFLALFAKYMYHTKGYKSCSFWGYEGALDSMAGQSGPYKTVKLASGEIERAKLHQIEFCPGKALST